MKNPADYWGMACHGLGVIQPIDLMVADVHSRTGFQFQIVGGIDPQPFEDDFVNEYVVQHKAGKKLIFIGHSKGAMMSFYLADRLKKYGIPLALVISFDSTCWASNAPGITPWTNIGPPHRGKWYVPDNVDRWAYYRQDQFPGGGYAELAPGNKHTKFTTQTRREGHIGFVAVPEVHDQTVDLVRAA
jgi:hypothetical protein